MRKDRNVKVLSIVALILALLGMSLGFAAFSSTLNISSSATVSPNSDDFKMVMYGLVDESEVGKILSGEPVDLSIWSNTYAIDLNDWGTSAIINNVDFTISNINASFSKPGMNTAYVIAIKNEGKYDSYLDVSKYDTLLPSKCVSDGNATQKLVDEACNGISLTLEFYDSSYVNVTSGVLKVIPNSYIGMFIGIRYHDDSAIADGDFSVYFDDVKLEFTTAPPSN
jgi:hypothetical protein